MAKGTTIMTEVAQIPEAAGNDDVVGVTQHRYSNIEHVRQTRLGPRSGADPGGGRVD
jgi:hypothetical protein